MQSEASSGSEHLNSLGFSATRLGQSNWKAQGTFLHPHKTAAVPDTACVSRDVGLVSWKQTRLPCWWGAQGTAEAWLYCPVWLCTTGKTKTPTCASYTDQMEGQSLELKFANGQSYSSWKCSTPVKAKHFQCQVLLVTAMTLTSNVWALDSRLLLTCWNCFGYKMEWKSTSCEFQCSLWKYSAYRGSRYF